MVVDGQTFRLHICPLLDRHYVLSERSRIIGFSWFRSFKIVWKYGALIDLRQLDLLFGKTLNRLEVGVLEVGTLEVGVLEVGVLEVGAPEVGLLELGAPEVGAPELVAQELVQEGEEGFQDFW
jgi:hypothetical protein